MKYLYLIIFIFIQFEFIAQIPTNGLQGYWPFNGDANEFLMNENNGDVFGATLTTDRCGNSNCAYEFDGVDDFIECTTDRMNVTDELSISLWFKKNSLGIGADIAVSKFSIFDFDTGYNIQFDSNGAPEIRGRDGNDFFSESDNDEISRLDDEWHHVVGIVDQSIWKIYIDTILVGSFDNGHSSINIGGSFTKLTFARRSSLSTTLPWNYYKGQLDDIAIYNRALDFDEVVSLFEYKCNTKKETLIEYAGCLNDGYEILVNGTIYNELNPSGVEIIPLGVCCDSIVTVDLVYQEFIENTITYAGCAGDDFEVAVNSILYNESNPSGQEILQSQSGCDSIINISLDFLSSSIEELNFVQCSESGFEVLVNSNTYNEDNPSGQEILENQFGCDSIINIEIIFEDALTNPSCFEVNLPNIFTPGQSENNTFRIRAPESVEILNLQIYDRWGNLVYDNDNTEQEWNGDINGEPGPSDVYIYTVTYQFPGEEHVTASSDLTLVR